MSLTTMQTQMLLGSCSVLASVRQEDDEQAWLAVRTNGIGGSDVGAICGVNKWASARQIYFRKVGQYQDETEPNEAAVERMHFGHMLEPVVAQEFANRHQDIYCLEADCTFKSNEHPYLLANVDRFVIDKNTDEIVGILECKTANENMNDEWRGGEVPMSYYYQVQHYLFVTGLEHAWISCLVGGNKFYTYDIFFDRDLYTNVILPQLHSFWFDCVLKLQEPPVQSADSEFFDSLFTVDNLDNTPIDIVDENIDNIGDKLTELKTQKKELEKEIEECKAKIKEQLQEHTVGRSPKYEFKWSPRTRTNVDTGRLRMEYPEIYAECISTVSYRQLSIKKVSTDD